MHEAATFLVYCRSLRNTFCWVFPCQIRTFSDLITDFNETWHAHLFIRETHRTELVTPVHIIQFHVKMSEAV